MIIRNLFRCALRVLLGLALIAGITGIHYALGLPGIVSIALGAAAVFWIYRAHSIKVFSTLSMTAFLVMLILVGRLEPSNDRDWLIGHSVLPEFEMNGDRITIRKFRNFAWLDGSQPKQTLWEERTYDLRTLERVDLVVEPFQDSDVLAHIMLRFHFHDQGNVVVSVEARQEKGETYGLVPGAFRQFELIYIFGSERDLMDLRAVRRGSRLYAFPVKAEKQFMIDLFRDLAAAADRLRSEPRFYRSIRDNCTTTLVKHADRYYPKPIGLRYETIFPALTGRLLYEWGYMDTDHLTYEEAKARFRVDERIRANDKRSAPPLDDGEPSERQ